MKIAVASVLCVVCCAASADDTVFIQSLLDKGGRVELPAREYSLSKTLRIPSGSYLKLADGARVTLAPGSSASMV